MQLPGGPALNINTIAQPTASTVCIALHRNRHSIAETVNKTHVRNPVEVREVYPKYIARKGQADTDTVALPHYSFPREPSRAPCAFGVRDVVVGENPCNESGAPWVAAIQPRNGKVLLNLRPPVVANLPNANLGEIRVLNIFP